MAPHVVQDPASHLCSIPKNYSAAQGLLHPLHTVKKSLTLLPSTMLIKDQPFDLLGGFCRQLIPNLQILLNLTFAVTCKSTHCEFSRLHPKMEHLVASKVLQEALLLVSPETPSL